MFVSFVTAGSCWCPRVLSLSLIFSLFRFSFLHTHFRGSTFPQVDLADLDRSMPTGMQPTEAGQYNKDLLALYASFQAQPFKSFPSNMVLKEVRSERAANQTHMPYRDSSLTQLLKVPSLSLHTPFSFSLFTLA